MSRVQPQIPIEDNFDDVITKAAMGLGLSKRKLAELSGVDLALVQALFKGHYRTDVIQSLAPHLGLDADKLEALALGQSSPQPVHVAGMYAFSTEWLLGGGARMGVNNYLLVDAPTRQAILFDTGVAPEGLLSMLQMRQLNLAAVFITHAHQDHVLGLPAILAATTGPSVYAPSRESVCGAVGVDSGQQQVIGPWTIDLLESSGHSQHGLSYRVSGGSKPLVFVGDALFALSMGGARSAYQRARTQVREHLLSLPADTVVCPGHGPLSTVKHELENNPFF